MDLNEEQAGGVTVLQVAGRIDSNTASVVGEHLTARVGVAKARLVVDLSWLDYISSAGLRILLLAAQRADESASKMILCGVSGKVRQLFDLGGILDLFTIVPTREEGIAAAG